MASDATASTTTTSTPSTSTTIVAGKRKNSTTDNNTNNNNHNNDHKNSEERKTKKSKGNNNKKKTSLDVTAVFDDGYEEFTLDTIKSKLTQLCGQVPIIPPGGIDPEDHEAVRVWGLSMQSAIEEFSLLLGCLSPATYRWGTDRSGAADQSLSLLSSELSMAQEQISTACSTRLTNVLAPVVDLVVEKVVTTTTTNNDNNNNEVKTQINHYDRKKVDPSFVSLCSAILCRNAVMLRQVVLANFHKSVKVIVDYQKAAKTENQNDRNLAY